jgi:hypothetical protein
MSKHSLLPPDLTTFFAMPPFAKKPLAIFSLTTQPNQQWCEFYPNAM